MKFSTKTTWFVGAAALAFGAVATNGESPKEDGAFWNRYLEDVVSIPPTPPPTPPPTAPPTQPPTAPPTLPPTLPPTPPKECMIDLEFNCTTKPGGGMEGGVDCEEIPPESQLQCSCPECVRELTFQYTGASCAETADGCTQFGTNPTTALVVVSDALNAETQYFQGEVTIGDTITIEDADCLPDGLIATIGVPGGDVSQAVIIDSQCDGGDGIILGEEYGAFESVGYSCDENDMHNCLVEIIYETEVCNIGESDEQVYEFDITVNDTVCDMLEGVPPEDLELAPAECFAAVKEEFVNRCETSEYCSTAHVNATNPITGPPCEGKEEIKFNWTQATLPPTPVTPAPSPAPTSSCIIDVSLDGCFNFTPIGDNNCQGRPVVISFRYNGGDCSQSDNLQDRQKFDCFDSSNPPPTTAGTVAYITATELGGGDTYFEGFVPVGDVYTLNDDRSFDKLSADMNITIYDPMGSSDPATIVNGANIMQTIFVHLSCSQPLFLKDRFGASQVVEWIEADGRTVSCFVQTETGSLTLSLNATGIEGADAVRLLEMNVISNTEGFINYTEQVNGVILTGGEVLELSPINVTLDLTERQRYTFFTTVVGETLDGSTECNGFDFHECVAGIALPPLFPTLAPTASPTITPYPTPDPETSDCLAEAVIECIVQDPFGLDCDSLSAPTAPRCTPGAELSVLVFEYTGAGCGTTEDCTDDGTPPYPEEVYIEITDCETSGFFQGTAFLGDKITVNSRGNFLCDTLDIVIQTVDFDEEAEENNGETLQTLSLSTDCLPEPGQTWVIGSDYGAMRLVQYTSDLDGIQSAFASILMNYAISNPGAFGATITSAVLNSGFTGPDQQLLVEPTVVGARSRLQLASESMTLDLIAASGTTVEFALSVAGSTDNSAALPCGDDAAYSLSL